jgi:O-antigen/teichoic acid export membrane protein
MKVRKLSSNYILSIIRILVSAIVGLLIMAHVNKQLGAELIGKVEYANTIINYFVMFSALGIPMYGVREIAKHRHDKTLLSKTFLELLTILLVTTIVSYVVLFILLYVFNFFADYKLLILVFSSVIFLTNIGADWFFMGMEDQLYITIRYVAVRLIALVILYLFVVSQDDYLIYAFITILYVCGSNIFNFYFIFKNIEFKSIKFKTLDIKRHVRPVLTIFIAAISVNIYLQLDNFLIGHISGDKYLGYYVVANKLIRQAITFITLIGLILLPRLSSYWETDKELYYNVLEKSFNYILIFAIPASFYFFLFSKEIIIVMAGESFNPSILTMQILSPLCFVVSIAYFIGYLILFTQKKEKIYTVSVIISAVFSVAVNLVAITKWQQNGAAVTQILAELIAVIIMTAFIWREIVKINILNFNGLKIIIVPLVISFLIYIVKTNYFTEVNFYYLLFWSFMYLLLNLCFLLLIKEKYITEFFFLILNKIKQYGGISNNS